MKKEILQNQEIRLLCEELALLIHAGVGMGDALSLMAREEGETPLGALLAQLGREVDQGKPLEQAMKDCGRFPAYVCGLTEAGQRTGHLEEALEALAAYYQQRQRMENQIKGALMYPALLLLIMLAVITVLLTRVLPLFRRVYEGLGGQLTGLAGGLYGLGQVLDSVMPLLWLLLMVCLGLLAAFGGSSTFRQKLLGLWQRRRGDKGVALVQNQARFAQGLAMGLGAGMPEEEALALAQGLVAESDGAQTRCESCRALLEQGESLARALDKTGLLPGRECRILELSQQSGAGDRAMAEIARRLEEQGTLQLSRIVGYVEPAMVIATSLLVGCILLSVMLPLMDILSAIG